MPFHWYFTSALPRALLGAYPLAALGYLLEPRVRRYVQLVTLYIALYSFLLHKEVLSTCHASLCQGAMQLVPATVALLNLIAK